MKLKHTIFALALTATSMPAWAQITLDGRTASAPYFVFRNDTVNISYDNDFTTIPVATNYQFDASTDAPWLTLRRESNGNISVFTKYNYMATDRTATVTVSTKDGSYSQTFVVRQMPNTLNNYSLDFAKERDQYFTDNLCSALKDGVTEGQVIAMRNPVLKSLATAMLEGSYSTDYRLGEYKAFRDLWDLRSELKVQHGYNNHENPTGIYFKKGEKVAVIVDGVNSSVQLQIRNFGPTNFDRSYYTLQPGVNLITPTTSGNGYIDYWGSKDSYQNMPKVKMHVVNGIQNGYFDITKGQTNEDYQRILANAKGECLDFVGEYVQTVFPIDVLKRNTPDGYWNLKQFDSIVYYEHQMMGMFKYNRTFPNHQAVITVAKSGGLYHASNDGCCIPYSVLSQPTTSNPNYFDYWGMAHELGHNNQTDGILWVGLTEVTNNIQSAYCEHKLKQNGYHRLENEANGERYYKWLDKGLRTRGTDMTLFPHVDGDVFCTLIPFYQLLVYTEGTGLNPDAYPDAYETMRTTDVPSISGGNQSPDYFGDGQRQVYFCKVFCDAAKMDFTDFFVATGFLKPYNAVQGDYDNRRVQITQAMVDEVINYVKSKSYPKAPAGLIFIDTYNKNNFRDQIKVDASTQPGTGCSVSGQNIRIQHAAWKGVVGFKTYDANGKLLHITNYGHNYPGRDGSYVPTYTECAWVSSENPARITAVSYDGTEVTCYQK